MVVRFIAKDYGFNTTVTVVNARISKPMFGSSQKAIAVPTRHHPFPLVSSQVALLVIDMQNDFCHPDGFFGSQWQVDLSPVRQIIPRIQLVIHWARQQGIPIIYTRESHRPDLSDLTPSQKLRYENAGSPVGSPGTLGRFLIQGERGAALIDELPVLDNEQVIDKPAHSAFVATDLEQILREQGITQLLLTGVTTECCVLGTYRHGSDLGFYGLLLEDCCAAFDPIEHDAALKVLLAEQGAIGWVTSSDQLLSMVFDHASLHRESLPNI
jgi:biuret amidohydrolase